MQTTALLGDTVDMETWVEKMIAENGYAQLSLYEPGHAIPGFAFTIGLEQSRGMPELLCLGADPEVVSRLFGICIDAHETGLCDLTRGNQDVADLIEGHVLRFHHVRPDMRLRANEIQPRQGFEIAAMMQVILPDDHGFFPGEPGCDPDIAAAQDVDWLLSEAKN